MEYTSKVYALLKRGSKRHFKEVFSRLDLQKEDRVLELGCARGAVVKRVQAVAPETYGIDINREAIEHGLCDKLAVMPADNLRFADESFDKLYSFHTIEHVSLLKNALQEMARVLKPGGRALLVYPAEPIRGMFALVASLIMFGHPFKARAIHVYKLTPTKLRELIKGTGLIHRESEFSLARGPEFFTVLQKGV